MPCSLCAGLAVKSLRGNTTLLIASADCKLIAPAASFLYANANKRSPTGLVARPLGAEDGDVDRNVIAVCITIGKAEGAARNLVEFLDPINRVEDFGAVHCFDVINATL